MHFGSVRAWLCGMAVAALGAVMLCTFGCASNSTTANSSDDPTTRAMADPMGYAPPDDSDISGGGISNFNSKDFNKDMNHVLNP
jgi:hypothetical protein